MPTGLFAFGNRKIDATFASYAWSNDVRIEKLTAQKFTEDYRTKVLGNLGSTFDSGSMTLALTAISLVDPDLELSVVNFFQNARYVEGIDTSDSVQVCNLLETMNLPEIADRILEPDHDLLQRNIDRLKVAN